MATPDNSPGLTLFGSIYFTIKIAFTTINCYFSGALRSIIQDMRPDAVTVRRRNNTVVVIAADGPKDNTIPPVESTN